MIHPVPVPVAIVLALLGLVGLGLVSWAASAAWRQYTRTRAGCIAKAKVIRVEKTIDSDGDAMYTSVFAYTDRGGHRREATAKVAQHPAAHKVGERVALTYDAGDPSNVDVVHPATGFLLAAVAGTALAGGMAWLYWGIRTGAVTITEGDDD